MAGKRIVRERIPQQLRLDEELSGNVRLIAAANHRPVPLQILHWIERGVESDLGALRHTMSQPQPAEVTNGHKQSRRMA